MSRAPREIVDPDFENTKDISSYGIVSYYIIAHPRAIEDEEETKADKCSICLIVHFLLKGSRSLYDIITYYLYYMSYDANLWSSVNHPLATETHAAAFRRRCGMCFAADDNALHDDVGNLSVDLQLIRFAPLLHSRPVAWLLRFLFLCRTILYQCKVLWRVLLCLSIICHVSGFLRVL